MAEGATPLAFALCVPDSCSDAEIEAGLEKNLEEATGEYVDLNVYPSVTKHGLKFDFDAGDVVML